MTTLTSYPGLVLASGSRYRRELLERIGLSVQIDPPHIDESALPGETPAALAERLSTEKALAVASRHSNSLIIASDQVADLNGQALGKPGTAEAARQQLRACSGQKVVFHTGLCLINTQTLQQQRCVEPFAVSFRELSDDEIHRYVECEPALDCAGSFKSEGLGITLFSALSGNDPNALVGLPLIKLIDFLLAEDYPVL